MARNADNGLLKYEAAQDAHAMAALTDSGDHTVFESGDEMWSRREGYEPDVKPDGLATGGVISVGTGDDNAACSALTAYIGGVLKSVAADTSLALTRGADTDVCCINSVVTDGSAISVVAGTDGAEFSETRGAAGGPPLIPVGSVEIGQVRLSSVTAAPVESSEIKQVPGTHTERYDYPIYVIDYEAGTVTMASALPLIHTGALPKHVNASYYEPVFGEIQEAGDFVPPETGYSQASKQIYGGTIGSSSTSLSQGTFNAYLEDGVSDALIAQKGKFLWFQFYPSRYSANYVRCQGTLGIKRTFPAGDSITAACTITAIKEAGEVKA